jgi:pyruvate dehydrogenase E1 component alpha subunit
MVMREVAHFEIGYTRHVEPDGSHAEPLPAFAAEPGALEALYRAMLLTRTFDARAISLQRTGRLGTFASSLGQEAIGVGVAAAMRPEDVLLPSFRDQAAQFGRGVTPLELLLYWGGDERGSDFAGPREDFPISITVGGHAPQAAGVALAFKLRGEPRVAVCLFGDGATSKGDVYEAMNIAGAWNLPVVFVVSNNQWAISVPRPEQTHAETLAQKAIAAGFPGEQVDGNDVVAVRAVVGRAIEAARRGEGPRLIEALTYRLADHTTVDDASRYRTAEEVTAHWREDPVARVRALLVAEQSWDREREEAAIHAATATVEAAVEAYLATPPQPAESMFDHLYAALPPELAAQRAGLSERGTGTGS